MNSSTLALRALGGAALLAAAGCYSPYGYGGYPTYGTPVGAPPHGGTIVAPGTTISPGPPGTFTQPHTPGTTGPEWRSTPQQFPTPVDPRGDAPPYNPGTTGGATTRPSGTSGGGTFVPEYGDPYDSSLNTTPFGSSSTGPSAPIPRRSGAAAEPEPFAETARITNAMQPFPHDERLAVIPATERASLSETMAVTVQAAPNPYAYDAEQYAWLRGKVDYDPVEKTWNIIYDLAPDESDPFQGSLRLIDNPLLDRLQNDDIVVLEGKPETGDLDERGKACYRVDSVFGPLTPQQ